MGLSTSYMYLEIKKHTTVDWITKTLTKAKEGAVPADVRQDPKHMSSVCSFPMQTKERIFWHFENQSPSNTYWLKNTFMIY